MRHKHFQHQKIMQRGVEGHLQIICSECSCLRPPTQAKVVDQTLAGSMSPHLQSGCPPGLVGLALVMVHIVPLTNTLLRLHITIQHLSCRKKCHERNIQD